MHGFVLLLGCMAGTLCSPVYFMSRSCNSPNCLCLEDGLTQEKFEQFLDFGPRLGAVNKQRRCSVSPHIYLVKKAFTSTAQSTLFYSILSQLPIVRSIYKWTFLVGNLWWKTHAPTVFWNTLSLTLPRPFPLQFSLRHSLPPFLSHP